MVFGNMPENDAGQIEGKEAAWLPIHLMLAEGHTAIRDSLKDLLEIETDIRVIGQTVLGRQALKLIRQMPVDVLIMDMDMPDVNSFEVTQQVKERRLTTQVILLSSHTDRDYLIHTLKAGARGYILKDSVGQEIVEAGHKVHKGRYYLSRRMRHT